MLTWLLPSRTTAQLSQGTMKKQPQPQRINIKVYLYKSLFSFLVLGLQKLSFSGCSYYLFGLKNPTTGTPASQRKPTHMANKDKVGKKKHVEGKRLSLLNCTWREIPLNSSWQRQWAGRQIKQSLSRSPINTSHSLASLQTPPRPRPLRSSCKSTEPSGAQHEFLSATFLRVVFHPSSRSVTTPARLETGLFCLVLASHCGRFGSFGFLHIHLWCPIGHQMTEAAPERGQEAPCTARKKKKEAC